MQTGSIPPTMVYKIFYYYFNHAPKIFINGRTRFGNFFKKNKSNDSLTEMDPRLVCLQND